MGSHIPEKGRKKVEHYREDFGPLREESCWEISPETVEEKRKINIRPIKLQRKLCIRKDQFLHREEKNRCGKKSRDQLSSTNSTPKRFFHEYKRTMTIYTLPYLKCIRLISVRSSLPFINTGVRIEPTFKNSQSCDANVRTV